MTTNSVDTVAEEIRQHLDSLPTTETIGELIDERVGDARETDDQLRQRIMEMLPSVVNDPELSGDIVRRLRFGGDPELRGSKFAALTVADVEWLYQTLESAERSGQSKRGPSEELRNAFDACSRGEFRSNASMRETDLRAIEDFRRQADAAGDHLGVREALRALRAMDTQESGYGQQLIGAQYVGQLWEAPARFGRVFPLVNTFTMTDPLAYLPVESDLPELFYVQENTEHLKGGSNEYDTTKTGSNRVAVNARKFILNQVWSGEMEEDSIIPFVPFLRGQAAKSLAFHMDSLVVNGDTTTAATGNINSNDAAPAATKHYLAFDGLRKAALVDNTANAISVAGALSYGLFSDLRTRMIVDSPYFHDWSHPVDPTDLVFLCDPYTAEKAGQLTEVLTVDKYGQDAIVLTGELGRVGRNPLIAANAIPKTVADGKVSVTPANNVAGTIAAWNPNGSVAGVRRQISVETDRMPRRDQSSITYTMRMGFGRFTPTGVVSGIESVAVAHGITL